ncbi:MAG: DUF2147 domain-containing protein [Candidatus Cloacimonetes bacterium]|nr:DUF2147 domain-containing protein [Candidatus Cloacimonadota bacterium]MCK9332510.1 DUF2147 domain-containing protein [Candidatus Cloacimonadota bacterium]MDD2210608.1 DUF2147 domain-containing protein [Candidatus Cloacimonadota bacterium]MDD4232516.1 DUF2147 domain-containing protein [Candidatus Cloacimonadota bacterium]MDY0298578.1 DUF2147 domain-containing protein [Candidatus Cloacimonadaceae bacterium]
MKHILFTILIICLAIPAFAQVAERINGVWYNGEKSSKIEIIRLEDGSFSGKIVWLREPNDANEKAKTDSKNPDNKLRKRPLIGLEVLTGLKYNGNNKYSKGKIYDPKSGKTYSAKAELVNNNTLSLRGFIGIALAGRTDTWIRTTK